MTDKEILELAAKAAGIEFDSKKSNPHPVHQKLFGLWLIYDREPTEYDRRYWNPLEDDGDALRLAAELVMDIEFIWDVVPECTAVACVRVTSIDGKGYAIEELGFDSCKAIRTAIVKTAAEIGKQK
jgi:hypothetical protein